MDSVTQSLDLLVAEARVGTLKSLRDYMTEKGVDIDKMLVHEFLLKGRKGKGLKPKSRTRPPSAYNLFIRDKMNKLRAAGHRGNLMRMAVDAWNDLKQQEIIKSLEEKEEN